MKKTVKISLCVLGLFIVLVVVAAAVPFLIDFNRFKPQIQEIVAEKANAKIDFESARLQIFPKIGINIKNFSVENADPEFNGTRLLSVGEVLINTQFLPLLTKKIVGRIEINKPEFLLVKKGLTNNITALIKINPNAPQPRQPQTVKSAEKSDPGAQKDQMEFLKNNVVIEGVYISNANATVKDVEDDKTETPVRAEDFNLSVTNIGLERDIKTEISSEINFKKDGQIISGPFLMTMVNNIKLNSSGLESATFDGQVDMNKLSINFKDAFVKSPTIPLNLKFRGVFKPTEFDLAEFSAQLHNVFVKSKANIQDFKALNTKAILEVKNDDLTALGDVLPQHKNLLMHGKINLTASLAGVLSKPDTAKLDSDLKLFLTGTDLSVVTHIEAVQPARGLITVTSQMLDIGSLVKPFMPQKGPQKTTGITAVQSTSKPAATSQPVANSPAKETAPKKDFELTKEQKKLLVGMDMAFKINLHRILYDDVKIEDFKVDMTQKNLKTQLHNFSVQAFDGTVQAKGFVDLELSPISFSQDFHAKNVKPEKLMAFIQPEHKDLIKGVFNLDLDTKGRGTTVPTLNKTLNGAGQFKFLSGQLNTPSLARLMQREFDQFVGGLAKGDKTDGILKSIDKVLQNPMLQKLTGKGNSNLLRDKLMSIAKVNIEDKVSTQRDLKDVGGKIAIKNGRVFLASQSTEPSGNYAVDASVGLDMTLGGTVIYHASEGTKKRMLSQSQYASLLMDKTNNLVLEANLGGTAVDPKVSLKIDNLKNTFSANAKTMVEKEARKSGEDLVKKVMEGKKDEVKKQVEDQKKNLEDEAKKQLKGLFGN